MRHGPALLGLLAGSELLLACAREPGAGQDQGGRGGVSTQTGGSGGGGVPTAGSTASGGVAGKAVGGDPGGGAAGSNAGPAGNSSGGDAGAGSGGGVAGSALLHADFEAATLGTYSEAMVAADFGAEPPWSDGLDDGRATIESEGDNQFLRVTYPADQFGPADGGVQFKIAFAQSHEELFFSYKVRFAAGFSFVKGGKLPGLVGGTSPTGCSPKPDGFSARNMWRAGGAIVQYVYWPDQPNTCGDDLDYLLDDEPAVFAPGTWQTVEHHVKINTAGTPDGVLEAWVDGALLLADTQRLWRSAGATYAIDTLYFSTFFGGSDATWAPAIAQIIDFDDLIVSTEPIAH